MGLAHIGKIIKLSPIEGADFIESATVVCGSAGKWCGTVKKGEFAVGDIADVFLQDALLPTTERFAFMAKNSYIVRMRRFKGVPSECLIMPSEFHGLEVGEDITERCGVTKYSKPLPLSMTGLAVGQFPSFIPKTDELNFQSVPEMIEWMRGKKFYSTVKADGSSATVFKYQGHFGCCSRNLELKETPGNAIWELARKYDFENVLPDGFAVQFETVGTGIQGNPMGLKGVDVRVFNLYDINAREYLNGTDVRVFCHDNHIPMVDIVDWDKTFGFATDEDLRHYAEGLYPNGKQREGVVIRPMEEYTGVWGRASFKVINLLYGK